MPCCQVIHYSKANKVLTGAEVTYLQLGLLIALIEKPKHQHL
ncbi:hypothetical protein SynROS8604_00419 [Synechococcus sp. ROS8604]|nr:hypothetical protein SynROS8604_00419 [Synechococcus sp. ROS8604]